VLFARLLKCVFGQEPSTLWQPSLLYDILQQEMHRAVHAAAAIAAVGKVLAVVTNVVHTCLHFRLSPETHH